MSEKSKGKGQPSSDDITSSVLKRLGLPPIERPTASSDVHEERTTSSNPIPEEDPIQEYIEPTRRTRRGGTEQHNDPFAMIPDVETLVEAGRVPIKLTFMESGSEKAFFYNIPPEGFMLGRPNFSGHVDPLEMSVEYFIGEQTLGFGELKAVRVSEAIPMDVRIAEARAKSGF